MECISHNDSRIDADDTSSLSDFEEEHKAIVIRQHGREDKVKVDNVKVEVCEKALLAVTQWGGLGKS